MKEFVLREVDSEEECCENEMYDSLDYNVEKRVKFPPMKANEISDQIEKRKQKGKNRRMSYSSNRNRDRENEEIDNLPDELMVPYIKVVPKDRTFTDSKPLYSHDANALGSFKSLTLDSILPYLLTLFLLTGGMMGFAASNSLNSIYGRENIYVNVSAVAINTAASTNSTGTTGSTAPVTVSVDLTPITDILTQLVTLLTNLLGGLPIGRNLMQSWEYANGLWLKSPFPHLFNHLYEWKPFHERRKRGIDGISFSQFEQQYQICLTLATHLENQGFSYIKVISKFIMESWSSELPLDVLTAAIERAIRQECDSLIRFENYTSDNVLH